jgi:hypothetical protein
MRTQGRLSRLPILFAALLIAVSACSSARTVEPARVADFGQGVGKVHTQLDTTFSSINDFITDDEIDRAVNLPILTDEDVPIVFKQEDIAKWDKAFSYLDQYVANLTLLLSPDNAKRFGDATEKLASELQQLAPKATASGAFGPVATAFAELGRLLIEAKAQSDALAAARIADPGIQEIFAEMAKAIGEDNQSGIRGTVAQHWTLRMAQQRTAFLRAKGSDRRENVVEYIKLRNGRDAQDLQLSLLRQSILDLAAAHSALARGSSADLAGAIAMIQQELDAARSLSDFFASLKTSAKTSK